MNVKSTSLAVRSNLKVSGLASAVNVLSVLLNINLTLSLAVKVTLNLYPLEFILTANTFKKVSIPNTILAPLLN